MPTPTLSPARVLSLDLARSGALVAMVVFHFAYDLELFGLIPFGTVGSGFWRMLAVLTAGSFLFLAGVSLWLAHGAGICWRGFWRRFGKLALAAGAVSGATYLAFPHAFVFFGILHAIALSSLLGLMVLRLHWMALAGGAVAVFLAPDFLRSEAFDAPWWWWSGLQQTPVVSVDYEPIFPWFAPFLLGMALAQLLGRMRVWPPRRPAPAGPGLRALAWPGRHSLVIYLVHQPILIGLIWLALQILG